MDRNRVWTWVVCIVGGVLAVPVVAFGAFAALNWRDRPPSADVRALEAVLAARPPVADADNGALDLLGLDAPPATAPRALGLQRRDWLRARLAAPQAPGGWEFPQPGPGPRDALTSAQSTLFDACAHVDAACASSLVTREAQWTALVDAHAPLLQRYEAMLGRTGWREELVTDARAPITPYQHAIHAQRLWLARAWRSARAGDAADAHARLEADGRFWRRVLAHSDHLVGKMVAANALQRHAQWTALAVAQLPRPSRAAAVPASLSEPLDTPERSLRRALAGEWLFGRDALRHMRSREGGARESLVFKPQDSSNRMARALLRLADASEQPVGDVAAATRRAAEAARREDGGLLRRLYNPSGRLLADIAWPAYPDYALRVADAEAARAAARAVVGLHVAGVSREDVARALARGPWRDAHTGRPFEWDADNACVRYHRAASRPSEPRCMAY